MKKFQQRHIGEKVYFLRGNVSNGFDINEGKVYEIYVSSPSIDTLEYVILFDMYSYLDNGDKKMIIEKEVIYDCDIFSSESEALAESFRRLKKKDKFFD